MTATDELFLGKPIPVGEGNGEERYVPSDEDRDRVIREMVRDLINEEFEKVLVLLQSQAREVTNKVDSAITKLENAISGGELENIKANLNSTKESLASLLRMAFIIRETVDADNNSFTSSSLSAGLLSMEKRERLNRELIVDSFVDGFSNYDARNHLAAAFNHLGIYSRF